MIFLIYTRALYFHHSLCLFCMVLPCCYFLLTFLIWQLTLISFCLKHTELILTISRSSSVYSCDTSCSISLTTLFFLLQQTFWKCPILLHSMHTLPYAGYCLGCWIPPQCLHGCCVVFWCISVLALFSFTFLDNFILSNCLDSVNVLILLLGPTVPLLSLVHASTPLLFIWSSFFIAVNSFITSSKIHLS